MPIWKWERHSFTLDKLIAVLVLCLGAAFIVWPISLKHYGVHLPAILLASSLCYLLFRGKLSQGKELLRLQEASRIRTVANIIFVVSFSLSIWLLWSNLYYRPPLYFALILVAVASIILDIFCLNEAKDWHIHATLSKIIILSLTIYAGVHFEFPGIYGVDAWWHNKWIEETVSLGHITTSADYYYLFPVFHIAGAMTHIITTLSTYISAFAFTGVSMAVSCVFVFLIGRKLVNAKTGLLAALIVSLTTDSIEWATQIIPMSLGFCFFPVILYLFFRRDRKTAPNTFLIILLSIAMILTHPIPALVTLLSLIAIFIGIEVYKRISKPVTVYEAVTLIFIAFFGITMLTRWMQSPPGSAAFFDWNLRNLAESLQHEAQFALAMPATATNIPFEIQLLNQGGHLVLLFFSTVGALVYLHSDNRTRSRLALIFVAGIIIVMPYVSSLFSLNNIIPGRWYIFLYVPLSILAAQGLLSISSLIKGNIGKLSVVMLVVLAIIFMMTTSNLANGDSPWVYNGAVRVGYTQSELTAIRTLSDIRCGCPKTDIYYGLIFPYVISYDEYMDMSQGGNEIFVERNYYLHHPEWNEKYTERIHEGGSHGNYKPEKVSILGYMRERSIDEGPLIYSSSGGVKVFLIPPTE